MDVDTPPAPPKPSATTSPGMATLVERNRLFAAGGGYQHATPLPFVPRQLVYVIICVDPRVDPGQILGVGLGDAIVARNVGGRVNDAVITDLAWVSYLKESIAPDDPFFEVAVIHHTDCGSALMADQTLRTGFAERNHLDTTAREALLEVAVTDPPATVRHDVDLLLATPLISTDIRVSGHVYDVSTGLLTTTIPSTGRAGGES